MKIIVATKEGKWLSSDITDCDEGEIVIFPVSQSEWNLNKEEIFMIGVTSETLTSSVTIKNIKIPIDFYKELIINFIEKKYRTYIEPNGKFKVNDVTYNLNDIVDELLELSSKYKEGDILKIDGRHFTKFK
jgi:hypothetical protein